MEQQHNCNHALVNYNACFLRNHRKVPYLKIVSQFKRSHSKDQLQEGITSYGMVCRLMASYFILRPLILNLCQIMSYVV